jgi:hypothetical protein
MNSLKKTARTAGVLYLILAVVGPFSLMIAGTNLIVPGDAAATAANIAAAESLFRWGMVGDSIIFLTEIVLSVILYMFLKSVNKTWSLVAMTSRLAMATLQGLNLLNKLLALLFAGGAGFLTAFEPDQLQALVMLSLTAYSYVQVVWGLFFGLHLMVMGYLVVKAEYIPAILGYLLMLTALGYLSDSYARLLLPAYGETPIFLVIPMALGELIFPLWLLIKGVKGQPQNDPVPEAA